MAGSLRLFELMDTSAAISLITARVVQELCLHKKLHEIILNGIRGDQQIRYYVEVTLSSTWNDSSALSNAMLWIPYCLPLSAQMPTEFET